MIFKDGKTFSAYVRSKLHSGDITLWYQEDELILDHRRRQSYCALIQTPTQI